VLALGPAELAALLSISIASAERLHREADVLVRRTDVLEPDSPDFVPTGGPRSTRKRRPGAERPSARFELVEPAELPELPELPESLRSRRADPSWASLAARSTAVPTAPTRTPPSPEPRERAAEVPSIALTPTAPPRPLVPPTAASAPAPAPVPEAREPRPAPAEPEVAPRKPAERPLEVELLDGLDPALLQALAAAGIRTVEELIDAAGLNLSRRVGVPFTRLLEMQLQAESLVVRSAPAPRTAPVARIEAALPRAAAPSEFAGRNRRFSDRMRPSPGQHLISPGSLGSTRAPGSTDGGSAGPFA
jgi:hypothetical protein